MSDSCLAPAVKQGVREFGSWRHGQCKQQGFHKLPLCMAVVARTGLYGISITLSHHLAIVLPRQIDSDDDWKSPKCLLQ